MTEIDGQWIKTTEGWVAVLDVYLGWLQDNDGLPESFPYDFSLDSLDQLEEILLDRCWPPALLLELSLPDFWDDFCTGNASPKGAFTVRVAAYLGEALLRIAGGGWQWQQDQPMLNFDDALQLPPTAPMNTVIQALQHRTGHELANTARRLQQTVTNHQAKHPDWTPTAAELCTWFDPEPEREPDPWLLNWLTEQETAFPEWRNNYGQGQTWDFTPQGYDQIENIIRTRLDTPEAVYADENADLVQGAAWYIGEITRHNHNNVIWQYYPPRDLSEDNNPYLGVPLIRQIDNHTAVPIYGIEQSIIHRDQPGRIRQWFKSIK